MGLDLSKSLHSIEDGSPEIVQNDPSLTDEIETDSRIVRTIEWDFQPSHKHYSPIFDAFGLQWL